MNQTKFLSVFLSLLLTFSPLPALAAEGGGEPPSTSETAEQAPSTDTSTMTEAAPQDIRFSEEVITLTLTQNTVTPLILPPDTTGTIQWKIDDEKVATVSGDNTRGTLAAIAPGATKLTITATTGEGEAVQTTSVSYTVTVSGIVFPSELSMLAGNSTTPTVTGYGDAQIKNIKTWDWKSNDSNIARVSSNGLITAVSEGTAVITCTATSNSGAQYTRTCTVTVRNSSVETVKAVLQDNGTADLKNILDELKTLCTKLTEESLSYISGLFVATEEGILHYNYASSSDPGAGVAFSQKYDCTGNNDVLQFSNITFVPKAGFSGEAVISYTGYTDKNHSFSGKILIDVQAAEGVSYSSDEGEPIRFLSEDFNAYSLAKTGRSIRSVTFTLPSSSRGKLYYNYTGTGNDAESTVTSSQPYYKVGNPSIDNLYFVPDEDFSGSVTIRYTGYDTSGYSFKSSVFIRVSQADSGNSDDDDDEDEDDITYSVRPGHRVYFRLSDFNDACYDATGHQIDHVRFSLPVSSRGVLYESDGSSTVKSQKSYGRTGTRAIENVNFRANNDYSGTVNISFTGYSSRNERFRGNVRITVRDSASNSSGSNGAARSRSITYYGSNTAIPFDAQDFINACSDTLPTMLSTIRIAVPNDVVGKLYTGYTSPTENYAFQSYRDYPVAVMSQTCFVPKAGFSGMISLTYTAKDEKGNSCTGTLRLDVSQPTESQYFLDMADSAWAIPSVDFLRYYDVTRGTSNLMYSPNALMRRGDFILMLSRAFSFPAATEPDSGYQDVPENSHYAAAIASARELGVTLEDNTFQPTDAITRQDAALFLYRCLRSKNAIDAGSVSYLYQFPDGWNVAPYAAEAMSSLLQAGILYGSNVGYLNPNAYLTRAQMAAIFHRALT